MKRVNIFQRMLFRTRDQEGAVLVIVMSFLALIILSTVTLSTMVQRDVKLIRAIKEKEQAHYMAEAGLNHALAKLKDAGFASRADFNDTMDTGSYSVTYAETGGRHLVTSVGTVSGISVTLSAEIADNTPTAMNYFSGAGNDIRINALIAAATIVGDIHANNDVYLNSGFLISWLRVTGDVSATGIVKEGTRHNQGSWDWWDNHVVINGDADDTAVVFEGADRITFPTFDYDSYKQAAIDADDGSYVAPADTPKTYNGVNLSPGNGIVYVDGDVTFEGVCTLNGGIVADDISVRGTLTQNKSGTRNVIIARDGDIGVFGRLFTEEALVYASQDIASLQIFAGLELNGIMLARRDITMWNFITDIDYNYIAVSPADMMGEGGEASFTLVSWNR